MTPVKSRRGVYYDLTKSPYEFTTPYGDIFKFSSQKKLDIYAREITKELRRVRQLVERHNLKKYIPHASYEDFERGTYKALYKHVEG